MTAGAGSRRRLSLREEGQAAVELVLVLPMLVLLSLALVQVGLVVRDQVLVIAAAREGAREAAVSPDAGAVDDAVRGASALQDGRLQVDIAGRGVAGSRVKVKVSYRSPTDLPMIGSLLGEVTLSGSATMRVEQ